MEKHQRKWLVLGGVLATTWLLVWLLIGVVSAGFAEESNYSFFLPAVYQHFSAYEWTEVGVPNVAEATFEIDPNRPETLYLGMLSSPGAWRSQDGGDSWAMMGNGLPITTSVSQFTLAPVSPTVIYAEVHGDPLRQIYRSLDGGDSWQGLTRVSVYRILSLAVNPITPTTVYVSVHSFKSPTSGGEVYRSTNGGQNWVQILPHHTLAADIVIDPQNPDTVYIGQFSSGVMKSTDGGDTWQAINTGLPSDDIAVYQILLHPYDSQTLYIVTGEGLFRSFDGGNSWGSFGAGLPVPRVSSLAFLPGTPEILFATPVEGDDYYGIYRSLDEGNSWQRFAPNPVNERPIKLGVQVGDTINLFVLYDDYWNQNGRFWKLGPISPYTNFTCYLLSPFNVSSFTSITAEVVASIRARMASRGP